MLTHITRYTIVLFCLGCLPWTAEAREFIFASASEPYLARDIAEAMITAAYQRLGHTVQFKHVPLERALFEANSGMVDGEAERAVMGFVQYPGLVPIRVPVAEDEFVAYGKGNLLKVSGWASLKPWRLVSIRGIKRIEALGPDYKLEFVGSAEQLFRFLQMGRADIGILTRGNTCIPLQLGITDIKIQEPAIENIQFYHHLNERHSALIPQIEATLQEMQKDGSSQRIKDEIRNRWTRCSNVATKQTISP